MCLGAHSKAQDNCGRHRNQWRKEDQLCGSLEVVKIESRYVYEGGTNPALLVAANQEADGIE